MNMGSGKTQLDWTKCLECNGAHSNFLQKSFYCFILLLQIWCLNCANVLLFRVKKKLQLFYYLGYLQQPRFEMCKGSIGDGTIAFPVVVILSCDVWNTQRLFWRCNHCILNFCHTLLCWNYSKRKFEFLKINSN